ncbi:hypothetical protein P154DRAFT_243839 [Amniculicola lignicola CBS 123094]|uniref:AN1-type domain-containing protein n=1 Tax=Amniculicola lignicola CBS 123094 TaxID=1392246 RepID=A0A6A5WAR5_9PLEO|nr:hypothetical protein P154DRAFT_243839 [Amniculicola lignicola CBS 123094]
MAQRTPSPNPATAQSYTAMKRGDGDVEAIGAHCQMAYCHQLDFLPFKCQSCMGAFCLDHRTEHAHNCAKAGEWARRNAALNGYGGSTLSQPSMLDYKRPCASPACKNVLDNGKNTAVHCDTCNREYCLKHRLPEEHNCKNLIPIGARPANALQQQRDRGMLILRKLREKTQKMAEDSKKKKSSSFSFPFGGSATKSAAAKAVLDANLLKKAAKGDAKVPPEKRIYLHVEASADTTKAKYPTGKFYYNMDWTVGRILDIAAKALQVENVNNRGGGEEDRLRVFHVESGRLMKFNEKMGDGAKSGNTIVLLRGVGDPNLIDL